MKTFDEKKVKKLLPKRNTKHNKALSGRVLVIAGARGMYGAAILASTAAARVGAGYVQLLTDLKGFPQCDHPDFLTAESLTPLSKLKFNAVAIGPGLSSLENIKRRIKELISLRIKSVVLDAGALSAVAEMTTQLPKTWILTPHEGELGRLLRVPAKDIQSNRKKFALVAQKKFGCIIVLKGHETLVAETKSIYKIRSGNAALAKAGTGDVLTGMIAGFLAQGLQPADACRVGVFVHGYIADEWLRKGNDVLSLMASDLLARLPKALFQLRHKER